jgi:predicted short-subunit dehydrogenase-like oxidoreductase (DUF2520 family)
MNIVIIGTGNTASVLGRCFRQAGHLILQVFGRDAHAASELAYELDTESTNYWSVVNKEADLYLLAVSDIAIEQVRTELGLPDGTVVHSAASVSKEVLKDAAHYGVFYPLQTLKKEAGGFPDIPIIIDASDAATLQQLEGLALSITDKVVVASDEQRLKLHVAAVFCNNFVNHLYALTEAFCTKEGLDFRMLHPLILETAERIRELSPRDAQTGPAIRSDVNTLEKHRQVLRAHPHLAAFYDLFSNSIQNPAL